MHLHTLQPTLIQRCNFESDRLRYDYMGSTEFEVGDQAKCLKRMFTKELVTRRCIIGWVSRDVTFWLVAPKSFDFSNYRFILQGIIDLKWRLKERTYIDEVLEWELCPESREGLTRNFTEAWFDFENGVFFTYTQDRAEKLLRVLNEIKAEWAKPDPPGLVKFKADLERLKARLHEADKNWFSLDRVREIDGEYHVWLNPYEQKQHNCGWFTLAELKEWLHDRGPIMMKSAATGTTT